MQDLTCMAKRELYRQLHGGVLKGLVRGILEVYEAIRLITNSACTLSVPNYGS